MFPMAQVSSLKPYFAINPSARFDLMVEKIRWCVWRSHKF